MTIAERIRITRQQKGWSQSELAEKSGVNYKSLSRYELGTSIPPANLLKDLANALDVSADFLLNDEDTEIKDKELFKRFTVIQEMTGESRKVVDAFLEMAIRDFKTQQTYS